MDLRELLQQLSAEKQRQLRNVAQQADHTATLWRWNVLVGIFSVLVIPRLMDRQSNIRAVTKLLLLIQCTSLLYLEIQLKKPTALVAGAIAKADLSATVSTRLSRWLQRSSYDASFWRQLQLQSEQQIAAEQAAIRAALAANVVPMTTKEWRAHCDRLQKLIEVPRRKL